jgi:hypothetical protein
MTISDISRRTGLAESTVAKDYKRGLLTGVKISAKQYIIQNDSILAWLKVRSTWNRPDSFPFNCSVWQAELEKREVPTYAQWLEEHGSEDSRPRLTYKETETLKKLCAVIGKLEPLLSLLHK